MTLLGEALPAELGLEVAWARMRERALASIPDCPGRAELHALVAEMLRRILRP
jgi:hypothetical protein